MFFCWGDYVIIRNVQICNTIIVLLNRSMVALRKSSLFICQLLLKSPYFRLCLWFKLLFLCQYILQFLNPFSSFLLCVHSLNVSNLNLTWRPILNHIIEIPVRIICLLQSDIKLLKNGLLCWFLKICFWFKFKSNCIKLEFLFFHDHNCNSTSSFFNSKL